MTKLLDRMFRKKIYIYKWGVIMANLMMTLRYIIKNSTDQAYIDMCTQLVDELKSYDKFGDDYNRIDDKFKIMNRESIARWLCFNYYIESNYCDCENCIYGGNCYETK